MILIATLRDNFATIQKKTLQDIKALAKVSDTLSNSESSCRVKTIFYYDFEPNYLTHFVVS